MYESTTNVLNNYFNFYYMNKLKSRFFAILLLVSILCSSIALSETIISDPNPIFENNSSINIYVFYGSTCPHCHELFYFLESLDNTIYPINVIQYEVWANTSNQNLAKLFSGAYGQDFKGVPTYFIGDEMYVGYSSLMNSDIKEQIVLTLDNSEKDPYDKTIDYINFLIREESKNNNLGNINETCEFKINSGNITELDCLNLLVNKNTNISLSKTDLSLLDKYNLSDKSLYILAMVLGFLDGFNPCAFFVLCFLLSMLVYAKSRKKMLLIGGVFVFMSGFIYFIFMSAWLNFFLVAKSITYVTLIAGLIAILIGFFNVKDFFFFKKGASLSISDKNKGKLMKKIRGLLKASSLTSMLIGTIILAISANIYELLCTAGFPMVFTKILTMNNLNTASYYTYLLLYNIFYVIPLIVIVLLFTFTFNAKKLSQGQGEALKLLSGIMMFSLGILLVFFPSYLTNITTAILTIVFAIILTFAIYYIKKRFNNNSKLE